MKHGLAIFATDEGVRPDELAGRAEAAGFESLFVTDHTHFPAGSHMPGREYSRILDPFVALSAAAAATSRIILGTGVCLVPQREPLATAKAVATLDVLSGGRFLFGVGAGWNREEMLNHGIDPGRRFALMRERVEAMKALWTQEAASYEGDFVSFHRAWSWPKPVQKPHPPVMVGGNGPRVLERVLAYGDEWLPEPEDGLTDRMVKLGQRASETGRAAPITVYGADPADAALYGDAGAHRCVYWLPPFPPEATLRRIEELASDVAS